MADLNPLSTTLMMLFIYTYFQCFVLLLLFFYILSERKLRNV